MKIEDSKGKVAVQQYHIAGFEVEDVLYLVPFVTFLNGLKLFLELAATVSPWVAIIFGWQYFKLIKSNKP